MSEITDRDRSEILYKLGTIEAKLEANRIAWVDPIKNLEILLEKLDRQIAKDFNEVRDSTADIKVDVAKNKHDIKEIEQELSNWKVRVTTVIAGVSVFWVLFGDNVRNTLDALGV